ncbi:hypothetical protein IWQ60_008110, partial [Tieghemiomyces parasiticus]
VIPSTPHGELKDLLSSPYVNIYKLSQKLDDHHLGLLLRLILAEFSFMQVDDEDLTEALVTLRFLRDRNAIDPKSDLYEIFSHVTMSSQVRAHIWAIGIELGILGVDDFVVYLSSMDYARIKSCASDLNWQTAMKTAGRHADTIPEPCRDFFYTASPIRLGPNQTLIVQTVRLAE